MSAPDHVGDKWIRGVVFNIRTRQDDAVAASIGFRPTPDDERILREAARPGESTSETLRRALRLRDHDR